MKKIILSAACIFAALSLNAGDWAPAGDGIKTRWATQVNPSAPHSEYPRPQMVRSEWMSLNGLWDYAITPQDASYSGAEGSILVPFAVESSLSGVQKKVGEGNALWYERSFSVPRAWKGRSVILHFDAVDWQAEVWVNGQLAGSHSGGYAPFSFNISPYLKKSGKQTVRVKVLDSTDDSLQPRGKQVKEPRSIWYTSVTGIWQSVWLEPVAAAHIVSYDVNGDIAAGTVCVEACAEGLQEGDRLSFELREGFGPESRGSKCVASAELTGGKACVRVPDMKTWSPDSPYLYGLTLNIIRNGKTIDSVDGYTAIRSITKWRSDSPDRNTTYYNRMALNGKPLFQFGPLDQGWWPDGLYTAPTDEALRFDIEQTKAWGFNMIRKHIKIEPARWYFWCDVLGMIVWQDMPSIGDHDNNVRGRSERIFKITHNKWPNDTFIGGTECDEIPQDAKDNFYKEWKEIIAAFKHFKCICVWVPFNEGWGQFDTEKVVEFTRAQDPTRLINACSGGVFKFCGDIQDCHHYASPAMNAFEGRMINVIGEYGGLGYPVEGHTWDKNNNWGYGKLFGTPDDVMKTYAKFGQMLKTFISVGCSAAVYTQTTDVENEINGLMTYDRIPKYNEAQLNKVNRAVIESMTE